MQLTNEWIELGKTEGRLEGQSQGRRELVLRLLRRRAGEVSGTVLDRINRLSNSQLDEFGEALLDFQGLPEVQLWLDQHG